jgi:hypothetical protein
VAADAARDRNLDPNKVAQAEHRKSNPAPSETDKLPPEPEVTPLPDPAPEGDDGADAGQAPEEYWAARTRHEITRANKAQLDFALAEGRLVAIEDVCSRWAAQASLLKDQLLGLHNRVLVRLPGEWQRQVASVVQEEVRRVLQFLADEGSREDGLPWISSIIPTVQRVKANYEDRTA